MSPVEIRLHILFFLGMSPRPHPTNEVIDYIHTKGVPKPTIRNILNQMVVEGVLERNGQYLRKKK